MTAAAIPPRTRYVSMGSIYAISPITEQVARTLIEKTESRPYHKIGENAAAGLIAAAERDIVGEPDEDDVPY